MADTKQKWQEIANRGLQDRFDPQTRVKFDEAVKRGLITIPQQEVQKPGRGAAAEVDNAAPPSSRARTLPHLAGILRTALVIGRAQQHLQ